jgi:hypothetical protein
MSLFRCCQVPLKDILSQNYNRTFLLASNARYDGDDNNDDEYEYDDDENNDNNDNY